MTSLRVGDVSVDSVLEWAGPYRDPLEMFPDATQAGVDCHRDWLEPHSLDPATGQMILAFRSYLLRTERLTILVDTCVGNDKNRPLRPNWHRQNWPWMHNLTALGVSPEDIDIVMCTHLHTDHVGWNTRREDGRWVPTFPNAKYLFHEKEFAYWEAEHRNQDWLKDAFIDSVLPVVDAGRAVMVSGDYEIDTGLQLEPAPGHTPGAVCLNLTDGSRSGVFCGDMMHHPLQVPESQWSTIFCTDPELARQTRTAFIDRYAETDTLVFPAQFVGSGGGHIVGGGAGGKPLFRFAS
jgi:glyoxylase-like metal-dependent hydrolase (beta-lactamase superfamily II)